MKKHLLSLLLFLLFVAIQAVHANPLLSKDSLFIDLNDTAFHQVQLGLDTAQAHTFFIHINDITLYFSHDEFAEVCMKGREICSKIHKVNTGKISNEIPPVIREHWEFAFVVDYLLERGRAALYDRHQKKFIQKISYRLETFDGRAERFYFLPDYSIFFSVVKLEAIGDQKWFQNKKSKKQFTEEW